MKTIATTQGANGYPMNVRNGVIGFSSFNEAEDYAKGNMGIVVALKKRVGWFYWEVIGEAYESYNNDGTATMRLNEDVWMYEIGVIPFYQIRTLEDFMCYIDSCDQFPADAGAIIEANGWNDRTRDEWYICDDGERLLYFNEDGFTEIKDL